MTDRDTFAAGSLAWEFLNDEIVRLKADNEMLRKAIRRLAEQDATLSVVGGNVIVEMDTTLTDAEREAVAWAARLAQSQRDSRDMAGDYAASMRGLLERLG